jgi:nucleotide-binding universal stress UspA family protein
MMFRSLMVPVDGSAFAEHALPPAVDLAKRTGATLHLVRVHQPPVLPAPEAPLIVDTGWLEALKAEERKYLADVQLAPMLADARVETALVEGFPSDALAAYARSREIDLIVMTTHGRGGISRFWLGSVADALVRQAGTPVLLVRPDEEVGDELPAAPPMRHFLIPTDGSSLSHSVLDPALELGGLKEARFTLLRVLLPLPPMPRPWTMGRTAAEAEILAEDRQRALTELDTLAAPYRARGLDVECEAVTHPNPATAILEFAATNSVDVIALATRGRSGWARVAMGSVADKVMRASVLPVLLYRPPSPGTNRGSKSAAESQRSATDHART